MILASEEAVKKQKFSAPCPRKSYYDTDVNSFGVCKGLMLPILVKAALASTTSTNKINSSQNRQGISDEEPDDSLLYAIVAGIFYAFVMVFLILANIHPSKSLLADLERYESLAEAREQKFHARIFSRFETATTAASSSHFDHADINRDGSSTNNLFHNIRGMEHESEARFTTAENNNRPQYHAYRPTNNSFRNTAYSYGRGFEL